MLFYVVVIAGGSGPGCREEHPVRACGVGSHQDVHVRSADVNSISADATPNAVRAAYGRSCARLVAFKSPLRPSNVSA